MVLREAKKEEVSDLFQQGYKVWSKGRTWEKYCADNSKEDAYGTRYVLECEGEIASSMILLKLEEFEGAQVYGIGSVLTSPAYRGKGYASRLLANCLEQIPDAAIVFLYSEIAPAFYERMGFRVLPPHLQKSSGSVCMARCREDLWEALLRASVERIPDHF